MDRIKGLLLAGIMMFCTVNVLAQPQQAVRIRGTITGFDGQVLQVKTRAGETLKVVAGDARINLLSPIRIGDIRRGSFVGVTAIERGNGLRALEVHLFPEAQRGTGEGHYDWDLRPGSSMTNANVDAIVNANNGRELTLGYKGGSQKIFVPRGVPIVTFRPVDKSYLNAGTPVFIVARKAADGNLAALRILVGKDGMKPPM